MKITSSQKCSLCDTQKEKNIHDYECMCECHDPKHIHQFKEFPIHEIDCDKCKETLSIATHYFNEIGGVLCPNCYIKELKMEKFE